MTLLAPFSMAQVESLVLLEDDLAYFLEHYSACSHQVLRECINAVQSLVRQAACKPNFVQPLLQAWSDILHSVRLQQPIPATRDLPTPWSFSITHSKHSCSPVYPATNEVSVPFIHLLHLPCLQPSYLFSAICNQLTKILLSY